MNFNWKKASVMMLALIMVISGIPGLLVPGGSDAYASVSSWETVGSAGIIKGFKDGSFRPNAEITRSEMAVMIANALGQPIDANAATSFADDKDIPNWAKGAVDAIEKLGLVTGSGSNEFKPLGKTTRAETITVLLNLLALQRE